MIGQSKNRVIGEAEVCSYVQSSEPGPVQLPGPNAQATATTDGVVGEWMQVAVEFDSRAEGMNNSSSVQLPISSDS